MIFSLIHSPLTGPDVWWPVPVVLTERGHQAITPELRENGAPRELRGRHFHMLVEPEEVAAALIEVSQQLSQL